MAHGESGEGGVGGRGQPGGIGRTHYLHRLKKHVSAHPHAGKILKAKKKKVERRAR